ncbi:hypothetical protein F0L68_05095 [Solihabitans fulvus]|uniref:Uncharacterized protein n=1 Tax=Solihabitans fulvus TaxID=1892852 RepID=A0A5B2XPC2_9PSEU|nr:hypothetical protein [Solihabitans fulvus]KAA2265226.1 hypothetical protein F0L68_05095 [Solihabitans fulvus]
MRIRTAEGQEYYLSDYHFVFRYRFVGKIGGKPTDVHAVMLDDFTDWNGLADAAASAKRMDFKFGGYLWQRASDNEVWPVEDGVTVIGLTGEEIEALAISAKGTGSPPARLSRALFRRALVEIERIRDTAPTEELGIQWPAKLPSGIGHDPKKTSIAASDNYIWGADGSFEYPHIHCFMTKGYITSALATLKPTPGLHEKRHFKFRSDLLTVRKNLLAGDDAVLDELEKVLRSLVTGEARQPQVVAKPKKEKKERKTEADDTDQAPPVAQRVFADFVVTYARENNVEVGWLQDAVDDLGWDANDLDGLEREKLEEAVGRKAPAAT